MNKNLHLIFIAVAIAVLVLPTTCLKPTQAMTKTEKKSTDEIPLPPPLPIDMIMEKSICRRMSVRAFTTETITDEELSTILWAAYGITDNGGRTIYSPTGAYSTVIYVIRSEATYKYNPQNHSLILFKTGNYLYLGMYDTAQIKFGLVWDKNILPDEKDGMAEIGMTGQNIYFDANALNLGTVTTGMSVEDLYQLGLPSNEKPEIIMPLGHPSTAYDFTYTPLPPANLPAVQNNTMTLAESINNRHIVNTWNNSSLSLLEESQLIWASYGYSYLIERVSHDRHRTLPSALDIYPFKVFAANQTAVYQYVPASHSLTTIVTGDRRVAIQDAVGATNISLAGAPWIILELLDTNLGQSQYQTFWYYETGAIAHNVLLEAGTLNLSSSVIMDIADINGLRTALGIGSQTNLVPQAVVGVGRQSLPSNHEPNQPQLTGPSSGKPHVAYNYTIVTTDPDGDNVSYLIDWGDESTSDWIGPYPSGESIVQSHTWSKRGSYTVQAKAKDTHGAESTWATLHVTMPYHHALLLELLQWLCGRFPHAFPLIRYLLQL